jgi:alkylhydroperoxidase family enzyme
MPRIKESNLGLTNFQKLLGHNQNILENWSALGNILENDALLSAEFKEQIRRTLAQENGCEYCKAKGKPNFSKDDKKLSIAIGFTQVFLADPKSVPDSSFEILKEYFCDEEISELCAFITFTTASQYFGSLMKLK